MLLNINSFILSALSGCNFFPSFLISPGHLCDAGEKGSPATAGEPLADSSAMVHLSVFSAALPSRLDFFSGLFYSLPCRACGNADHFC